MTKKEREYLITFIQTHDSAYDYNAVNFKYYSDMDLLVLKARLELKMNNTSQYAGDPSLHSQAEIVPKARQRNG